MHVLMSKVGMVAIRRPTIIVKDKEYSSGIGPTTYIM